MQERARDDVRDLQLLQPLTGALRKMPDILSVTVAHALPASPDYATLAPQIMAHSPSLLATEHRFETTHEMLHMAASFGLNLAGEASKVIERTRPELIEQYPDFPWVALKRLRDYNSHIGRFNQDPQQAGKEKAAAIRQLNRFMQAMQEQDGNERAIPAADDAATRALRAGLRLCVGLFLLSALNHDQDRISLDESPQVRQVCDAIGCSPQFLPMIIAENAQYNLVYSIGDTTERISCFYRRQNESPLSNKRMRNFLSYRDKTAHFGGTLEPTAWIKSPKEMHIAIQTIEKLDDALAALPLQADEACVENYAQQLATEYQETVLGKTVLNPQKCAAMDQMVENITGHKLPANIENAYVRACGKLLREMPLDRAQHVFDTAMARGNLKRPAESKRDLTGVSHQWRSAIRDFYDQVAEGMAPPGANRIHRHG